MRKPPISVLVIATLFLALGVLDVYLGLVPLFHRAGPVRLARADGPGRVSPFGTAPLARNVVKEDDLADP